MRSRIRTRSARHLVLAAVSGAAIVLATAASTAAAQPLTWHRLNPFGGPNGGPEHERYLCLPGTTWSCRYDKLPEPRLGFSWNQTRGVFTGEPTSGFDCPDWFSETACDAADTVVTGVGTFSTYDYSLRPTGSFSVDQQLLVGDDGNLWIYWVSNGFACPWYPTFAEALTNDPACVSAP